MPVLTLDATGGGDGAFLRVDGCEVGEVVHADCGGFVINTNGIIPSLDGHRADCLLTLMKDLEQRLAEGTLLMKVSRHDLGQT